MHCNTLHEIARNMTFKGFLLQTSSAASNTYDVGCFTGTPFHCLTCFLLFEAIFCLIHTSRLVFPSLSPYSLLLPPSLVLHKYVCVLKIKLEPQLTLRH